MAGLDPGQIDIMRLVVHCSIEHANLIGAAKGRPLLPISTPSTAGAQASGESLGVPVGVAALSGTCIMFFRIQKHNVLISVLIVLLNTFICYVEGQKPAAHSCPGEDLQSFGPFKEKPPTGELFNRSSCGGVWKTNVGGYLGCLCTC